MEKFSAYRDPGTGIQPFSVPVPPASTLQPLQMVVWILGSFIGVFRIAAISAVTLLYFILVEILCFMFISIRPLHRALTHAFTFILARLALCLLGVYWIPVKTIGRKRTGRNAQRSETWNPTAGDLIVSNWASWIELLWLAIRCNPVFVLPIPESIPKFEKTVHQSTPVTNRSRKTINSVSVNPQKHSSVPPIPIKGFCQVSLLRMIRLTGCLPPYFLDHTSARPLEEIRKSAGRPVVVFPECTTSNGRGLLRFANVFNEQIPVKDYRVFIMCVRYDPPTTYAPTLTCPGLVFLNPMAHIFKVASSLFPLTVSVRLLPPSESPSSQLFLASEYVQGTHGEDQLAEASANLISQIGRLKRTGMGWEDKASFFHYRNRV